MAAMPLMTLLKISRKISYVAVLVLLLIGPGVMRAEDSIPSSYLDGIVRDYFQKWEDSLQGGSANETIFQLTEVDRTFNTTTHKTIKIQFQKDRKTKKPQFSIFVNDHEKLEKHNLLITNGTLYEYRGNQIKVTDFNANLTPTIIYSTLQFQNVLSATLQDLLFDLFFSQFYCPKSTLAQYEVTRFEDDGKTVAFSLRRKKPKRSWAPDMRRVVFRKSGGFPIQFEMGESDQLIYDVLKMDPRPAFDPATFDPPTKKELEARSSKYNNLVPVSLRHPLHPGPQPCNESQ